jgi:hypothetical protein
VAVGYAVSWVADVGSVVEFVNVGTPAGELVAGPAPGLWLGEERQERGAQTPTAAT